MKIPKGVFRSILFLFMLGMRICWADNLIYVANSSDGTVSVIDQNTNSVAATVAVGPGPFDMVITPDGTSVFVLTDNSSITLIDASTSAFQTSLISPSGPLPSGIWNGLGISPDGSTIYLSIRPTNALLPGHIISFSSTFPYTNLGGVSTGTHTSPGHTAILLDGTMGYTCLALTTSLPFGGAATDFDTSGPTFIANVNTPGLEPNFSIAADTPNGARVFLTSGSNVALDPGNFIAINPTNNSVLSVQVGPLPEGVAVSPIVSGNQYAYTPNSNSNTVSVIDDTTLTVVATVTVGSGPDAIVTTTDGQFAYVANFNDNTVSILDISSPNLPVVLPFTIPVGLGPDSMVTGPGPTFITPPTNLTGIQKKNDFGLLYELFNLLQWQFGTTTATSFNIYRDGVLIANVSGTTTQYEDHDRKKNVATTYAVTALNSTGTESSPITVVVN